MKTSIVCRNNKLWIQCGEEQLAPAAYMTYLVQNADYAAFRKMGYRLFSACVNMGDYTINPNSGILPFSPHVWKGRGEYDFTPLSQTLHKLSVETGGDFYLLLRVNVNAPKWWLDAYPEERTILGDGEPSLQSVFSARWISDVKLFLEKLCGYLKDCAYCDKIVGLQLAAMHTEEWIAVRTATGAYDYSDCAKKAFDAYLYDRYGILEGVIPSQKDLEERTFFPAKNCDGLDLTAAYLRFFNEEYANVIKLLSAYTKKICDREWLVGAFCGYIGQLGCDRGHCAFSALLDDDNIDFFASPFAYPDRRQTATDWFYHSAMDSCNCRNKLWFLEADVRTYKTQALYETNPELMDGERTVKYFQMATFFGPKTETESLSVLLRSFAKVLISGDAFWWFDMWGGWYASVAMVQLLQRVRELYETEWHRETENADRIAVILNENASYKATTKHFWDLSYLQFIELGFSGVPYALFLDGDISDGELAKYKLCLRILPDGKINTLTVLGETLKKETAFTGFEIAEVFQKAGGHVYSKGNIVFANARFIALTATEDGIIPLKTPNPCRLKAFTDGVEYCGQEFAFPMKKNQTELFEVME